MCIPFCSHAITHIVNFSLQNGIVPSRWKQALITPIPKKDKVTTLNDLRPISILPTLSKILEKIVFNQLKNHIDAHDIHLPNTQSGFGPGYSTTALLDIVDDMLGAMDKSMVTISVMLDYSKAFDCIDHSFFIIS